MSPVKPPTLDLKFLVVAEAIMTMVKKIANVVTLIH
jgi:hypothetical protein